MPLWTHAAMPSLAGRTALITGANIGLGFETAAGLAQAGAQVILGTRDTARGEAAAAHIRQRHPSAQVSVERLDLASLAAVADCAGRLTARLERLDILINNAGVMALPRRQVTANGFEMQFGVNHLGHFALTLRLLTLLRAAPAARVVHLSSLAHRRGRIDFDDPHSLRRYAPWAAYQQSKLAVLLFAMELHRRVEGSTPGRGLRSIPVHPGIAASNLFAAGPGSGRLGLLMPLLDLAFPLFGQTAAAGAQPTLFAAAAPEAQSGCYYGPTGWGERRGPPGPAWIAPQGRDLATAARLWTLSEQATGLTWPVDVTPDVPE